MARRSNDNSIQEGMNSVKVMSTECVSTRKNVALSMNFYDFCWIWPYMPASTTSFNYQLLADHLSFPKFLTYHRKEEASWMCVATAQERPTGTCERAHLTDLAAECAPAGFGDSISIACCMPCMCISKGGL